jgi:hypothetical protein
MTLPSGTTCQTKIEDVFRTLLSGSSSYQSLVSADDATAALATIHVNSAPQPSDSEQYTAAEFAAIFNRSLIWIAPFRRYRAADTNFPDDGTLHLILRRVIPAADLDDREKAARDFSILVDGVIEDLIGSRGEDGTATIRFMDINTEEGVVESEDDESEPYPWHEIMYDLEFA